MANPLVPNLRRLKLCVRGAVQGVGFRPFVFRIATELNLAGWVNNSPQGVFIEIEGPRAELEQFLLRIESEKPPRSFIQSLEAAWLDSTGYSAFEIRESEAAGSKTALVLPDIATCPDCLREIFDPANRRHRYPFTNCTNCGPRFSIIEALPYDRANTSMKQFTMCPQCQAEYDDPRDRRFHAQPNACPVCGPRLEFWQPAGDDPASPTKNVSSGNDALLAAARVIHDGQIVAVKGIGGFHLMVAAHDDQAVRRLRERKQREEKPFAVMFPSLESVKAICEVSPLEERLLRSPEAPIVLLRRQRELHPSSFILHPSLSIAPGNPNLGVLLPSNPLHHLLLAELQFPVVATSGNLSDEPICIDEREALDRLGGIADFFLVHNRPIVRHVDDSIVRVVLDREMVLRRARGYAPLPIQISVAADVRRLKLQSPIQSEPPHVGSYQTILAVGAHLKNSVALSVGQQVFLSQHIGDLETEQAHEAFRRVIADFEKLYEVTPTTIATDLHPDYLSTKYALERTATKSLGHAAGSAATDCQIHQVQHHIAHVLSCMAENEVAPPALGVAWDGTGYGPEGTIWGGEFFLVSETACDRVAHLRPFRLPGGDKAVKEPRRAALGLLWEALGEGAFELTHLPFLKAIPTAEVTTLRHMLQRGINSPITSSAGRLFDAVAALIGLRGQTNFEGQTAMELEFTIESFDSEAAYAWPMANSPSPIIHPPALDWFPMIQALLGDVKRNAPAGLIAAKFHNTMAELIVAVAQRFGQERVLLSGGCFQNRYLTERTVRRLQAEGFRPYWHQRVPPNDGGIALGQIIAATRALK